MGKRELIKKARLPRDLYPTIDPDAVKPLLPYIKGLKYVEPCAGAGDLINLIGGESSCRGAYDIDPQVEWVLQRNCLTLGQSDLDYIDCFISNPPFSKDMLLPIIEHLSSLRPTWLLLPADISQNKYIKPYSKMCSHILSVGRLCWFKSETGKTVKGVDNYSWYLFDINNDKVTTYVWRN